MFYGSLFLVVLIPLVFIDIDGLSNYYYTIVKKLHQESDSCDYERLTKAYHI